MFAILLMLAAAAEDTSPGWSPLVLPIMLVVLGYFILFRPMQRQEKERQSMVSALKKKDRVQTSGGIIAIVDSIKDNEVTLKIDENSPVRLRVTKSSIVQILTVADEAAKETKEGGE